MKIKRTISIVLIVCTLLAAFCISVNAAILSQLDYVSGSCKDSGGTSYSTFAELYSSSSQRGADTGCPNILPDTIASYVYVNGTQVASLVHDNATYGTTYYYADVLSSSISNISSSQGYHYVKIDRYSSYDWLCWTSGN